MQDTTVNHVDDLLAVCLKLSFDLSFVFKKGTVKLGVLRILLDCGDGTACCTFARDEVFEGDGEKISLIGVNITTLGDENLLKEIYHVIKTFSLLSDTS